MTSILALSVASSRLLTGGEAGGRVVGCPMHSPGGKELRAAGSPQPVRTEALSPLPVRAKCCQQPRERVGRSPRS